MLRLAVQKEICLAEHDAELEAKGYTSDRALLLARQLLAEGGISPFPLRRLRGVAFSCIAHEDYFTARAVLRMTGLAVLAEAERMPLEAARRLDDEFRAAWSAVSLAAGRRLNATGDGNDAGGPDWQLVL